MKILVTGGTGFIGGAIAQRLLREDHEVIATGTDREHIPEGAQFLPVNLTGIDWNALRGVEIVFHQAAINDTTYRDRKQMLMANTEASDVLLHMAEEVGCKTFVFASSTAVYGTESAPFIEDEVPAKPGTCYGESKMLFENACRSFSSKMNIICLRYCNVYGPGEGRKGKRMSMVGQIGRTMALGKRPRLFKHGEQKRDWAFIDDVVEANMKAMQHSGFGIYNVGLGTATAFNDVVRVWNKHLGTDLQPEYIDNPFAEWYQSHTECHMDKAKDGLGFVPQYDIDNGIAAYLERELKDYANVNSAVCK